jgi:hypothetical protein
MKTIIQIMAKLCGANEAHRSLHPNKRLVSVDYGNVAGIVKTQSRSLTGVWHDVQTFAPF